jgi:hypothetical protein
LVIQVMVMCAAEVRLRTASEPTVRCSNSEVMPGMEMQLTQSPSDGVPGIASKISDTVRPKKENKSRYTKRKEERKRLDIQLQSRSHTNVSMHRTVPSSTQVAHLVAAIKSNRACEFGLVKLWYVVCDTVIL